MVLNHSCVTMILKSSGYNVIEKEFFLAVHIHASTDFSSKTLVYIDIGGFGSLHPIGETGVFHTVETPDTHDFLYI